MFTKAKSNVFKCFVRPTAQITKMFNINIFDKNQNKERQIIITLKKPNNRALRCCCFSCKAHPAPVEAYTKTNKQTHTVRRHLLTRLLLSVSLSPSCVWRRARCLRSSSTSSRTCVSSSVCSPFTWEPSPWLLGWLSLPEMSHCS